MKKNLLTKILILSSIYGFSSVNADMIRINGGATIWKVSNSGKSTYTSNSVSGQDTIIEETKKQPFIWFSIKHPLPILPNIRMEYTQLETNGVVTGSLSDFTVPSGEQSKSNLKIQEYDVIPYYNLLDNTAWTTLDVGLDFKILNTDYTADSIVVGGTTVFSGYKDKSTLVIPLGYIRGRLEIPTTDIGLEAEGKYITYNGSSVIDARIKFDYTFNTHTIINPGIEFGYKYQKYDLDDNDGTKINLKFNS